MPQKYKVYINNKEVIFTNNKTIITYDKVQLVSSNDSLLFLKETISKFELDNNYEILLITSLNPKTTFKHFAKDYVIINAAGGIVKDDFGSILAIYRNEKWDLPKGKIDKGETFSQCAIREVKEETGLSNVKIKKKLQNTYHAYKENNKNILKRTQWFEMVSTRNDKLNPQKEEGITDIKWFSPNTIEEVFNNTYLSIRDLIIKYLK